MTKLYVTEYQDLPSGYAIATPQLVREPCLVDQTPLTIGATSIASPAFNAMTKIVRLHADSICSVIIGPPTGLTATANNQRFAANQTEYKFVAPGCAVAVIQNT